MSFRATVFRVAIASPSDIPAARDAVEEALYSWNLLYAETREVLLLPWRWESSSVPVLGDSPQRLINDQGIDSADILIALFGAKLGSPTEDAISGTVEEIERALKAGKPVHVYFSTALLPNDVDTNQLEMLRKLKKKWQNSGLLGEFNDATQLSNQV